MIGTGLHHSILELEQPALRAPTGTMVSGIAKLKQSKGQGWGKNGKRAQQAQEACERDGETSVTQVTFRPLTTTTTAPAASPAISAFLTGRGSGPDTPQCD